MMKGENMARYRRGWNGLTQISPEPVFIPEVMELQVFDPNRKRQFKIRTMVVKKKSRKNLVLKLVTAAAGVGLVASACTLERPTVIALVVFGVCAGWITLFFNANKEV